MTFRPIPLIAISLFSFLLIGCGPATGHFQIAVRNETNRPLTIGLAKTGGPYEELWASPEDIAIRHAQGADRIWGPVVPPGKTATLPQVTGKFGRGSVAILRVYSGTPDLSRMLATSRGAHDRLDLGLDEGKNFFIIRQDRRGLNALRLAAPPPQDESPLPQQSAPAAPAPSPRR
jgi:hypothetical protein